MNQNKRVLILPVVIGDAADFSASSQQLALNISSLLRCIEVFYYDKPVALAPIIQEKSKNQTKLKFSFVSYLA